MRGFLTYGTYRLLGALTGPLPPRAGYALAHRVGSLLCASSSGLTQALTHNIRHVLGSEASEAEVQVVVRQICVNIAKGHYDLFHLSRLTTDQIRRMTQIEGQEHFDEALARGKGVIVISAHLGNVDIMGQLPAAYGVPMLGPVMRVQPERLFQYTLKLRQIHGLRLIPIDGPLLEVYRALKRGEIVGLPCDRGIADNSRPIEFFGAPASLPTGPIRLALRTGAALLPAFALRQPDETFRVQVEPVLELQASGDREADVAAGMRKMVAILERYISRYPEQWLVAAPVWPMAEQGA